MRQEWTHWRRLLAVGVAGLVGMAAALEIYVRARQPTPVVPPGGQVTVTLVVLGDSIVAGTGTEPWPAHLEAHLRERYAATNWRVINAGVPGDTAPLGLARFRQAVAAQHPHAVLIAFGLNDCHLNRHALDRFWEARVPLAPVRSYAWRALLVRVGRAGLRRPPVPERRAAREPRTTEHGFSAALAELVRRSEGLGARPVLLAMTPLSPEPGQAKEERRGTYPLYNARIRQAATDLQIPLVEPAGAPPGAWLEDGLHLSPPGQAWLAAEVFAQLDRMGFWTGMAQQRGRARCDE